MVQYSHISNHSHVATETIDRLPNTPVEYVVYPSDGVMVKDVIKQVRAGDTAYDCLQAGMNKDITPMSKGDVLADL